MAKKPSLVLPILAASLCWSSASLADEYLLGPMDRLNVKIVEWQPSNASLKDWSTVNGDYTVTAAGNVELPFLGPIKAAGRSAAQLADDISAALEQKLALTDQLGTSIQVVQFRPIYLSGDVQTPGSYPYAPGLTLLKAVSLGGGLRHVQDAGGNPNGDFITAKGQYDVLVAQRNRQLAMRARLQAQLAGQKTIPTPDTLKGQPDAQQLMADELAIMQTQQSQEDIQLQGFDDLKTVLNKQIASLADKDKALQSEMNLLQKELGNIHGLASQGLAINSQVLLLEQQVADLQSRMLDTDVATLSANKDIATANQQADTLKATQQATIQQALQVNADQLAQLNAQLETQRQAMLDAVVRSAAAPAPGTAGMQTVGATYSIVRNVDGKAQEIQADENTVVLPGDVIKVALALGPSTPVPAETIAPPASAAPSAPVAPALPANSSAPPASQPGAESNPL
ncbi:MAG TPA: polysaccharide biosynthesis/export family protein [Devosia sp.]|nr:polysaccharide biosynthesis/export family protein [Devosia sp.]